MKRNIPPCSQCKNNNKLFCGLSSSDKDDLSINKDSNFYKDGQTIFYEGNYPHGLYCIYKGKVKLSKIGKDGKEQIIRLAGKGEVLGYRALLSESTYNATATTLEDSEICHISKGSFLSKLEGSQRLSVNMMGLLSHTLKEAENRLLSLTQNTVGERVAQALLLLKAKFGLEDDHETLAVTLTRREIGEIASITTETSIRTLSEFKKEQIVDLDQKKIKILDLKRLTRMANFPV